MIPSSPEGAGWWPFGTVYRPGEEKVMESEGSDTVSVRTDWLDRRLAFAFALIGDGPKPAKGAAGS